MCSHESPVFRRKEVLSPNYLPDHLPHREGEIKTISQIINQVLNHPFHASNIFIFGSPGTGKTSSIRFIFNRLSETRALPIYLNCFRTNTRMGALYAILIEFFRRVGPTRKMPSRRGVAYDELFDLFCTELRKNKVIPVICFDEIDHLLHRGPEILYDLSRLKEESLPAQLVMITNDQFVFTNTDPRIRSSLQPVEEVHYKPYSFEQMKEIIGLNLPFRRGLLRKEASITLQM
jgi:cell division control protein 6